MPDIRVIGEARDRRYHEIADELGGGFGYDFHLEIIKIMDKECRLLDEAALMLPGDNLPS